MRPVTMAPPSNFVALRRVILGGAERLTVILYLSYVLVSADLSDSFG
jgi:hypothetical protein